MTNEIEDTKERLMDIELYLSSLPHIIGYFASSETMSKIKLIRKLCGEVIEELGQVTE